MVLSTPERNLDLMLSFFYINILKLKSFVKHYFNINYPLFSIGYVL